MSLFSFLYHGLQRDAPCTDVGSLGSSDEINLVSRVRLFEAGETGAISRVRLVEAGNTGEICSGEGGGDGNGIITGCKGAMY